MRSIREEVLAFFENLCEQINARQFGDHWGNGTEITHEILGSYCSFPWEWKWDCGSQEMAWIVGRFVLKCLGVKCHDGWDLFSKWFNEKKKRRGTKYWLLLNLSRRVYGCMELVLFSWTPVKSLKNQEMLIYKYYIPYYTVNLYYHIDCLASKQNLKH